ncbi:MAG: GTP-binding protein [Desulfobacterales bacterium]|nr:MAG: GTP-binding protein [Desulfobacterales bacterium]
MLIKKKVCLLGAFAVGKSSLVERFVYDRFDEKYLTTIGVKVSQKILAPRRDSRSGQLRQYMFLIWDIASLDKFDHMVMNYYRGAAGALAIGDLPRPETFTGLEDLCAKFKSVSTDAEIVVLGNKLDIFQPHEETIRLLKKTAQRWSPDHLLTSAKTGHHVEKAFQLLATKIGNHS